MKMSDEVTDYREATLLLKKMGLRQHRSRSQAIFRCRTVISSAPEAGTVLKRRPRCAVRQHGRKRRADHRAELRARPRSALAEATEAGLLIGDVSYEESEDYGKDLSQIRAYRAEARQTKLDNRLCVSLGAPETTAPETTEEVTEARRILRDNRYGAPMEMDTEPGYRRRKLE